VLEERVAEETTLQYVWSPVYIDAMILRDRDADENTGNGLEERLYVQQDANYNVTALLNLGGSVGERFAQDAYGTVTYLNADWTSRVGSGYGWVYLHQGGRSSLLPAIYHFRRREYLTNSSTWAQIDPLRYEASDVNLYRYNMNSPLTHTDSMGLFGGSATMAFESCKYMSPKYRKCIATFFDACKVNNIPVAKCYDLLRVIEGTDIWRLWPQQCIRWAYACDRRLPPRLPTDELEGYPKGTYASITAWPFKACLANGYCIVVDGHFGIVVKFPDGTKIYFDDGQWGGCFLESDIPPYAL
jgi:RHS repeat-associated protein